MLDFLGSSNHLGSSKYHSKSLSKMRRKTDTNNGMKDREQKLDESDSDAGAARAGWKRRRQPALDSSEDEEQPGPSAGTPGKSTEEPGESAGKSGRAPAMYAVSRRQEHNSGRGNRTPQPCGLGVRITEPSARCTKKARRTSVGEGWSLCRACWLQQQGTQTEKQAHHALWRKRKAAKELQEVPVVSASHKDSEVAKLKESAILSKKSSPEGPPANKIVVQKSKESVESGESDNDEKEEEVTQCPNNSQINSGTQYDTIIVSLLSLCVILCLTREKFAHSFRD